MADEIDVTNERVENETALLVADAARKAASIPTGYAGECYFCGEEKARVVPVFVPTTQQVEDVCGGCRDKRGLP